jgi:cysteine dioxygenase
LSINISTDATNSTDSAECSPLTFQDLVDQLGRQSTPPGLEQITSWLKTASITSDDLSPFVGFKEGNYWRHRVCRTEAVEMLILCWRPGQKTPIHDHNGSHGVVKVHEGVLWESNFVFHDKHGLTYRSGRECKAGDITGAAVPDIHQLGNPEVSGQDLITIHIYAPPLGVLKTYKVGSAQVDLYTPNDFPS